MGSLIFNLPGRLLVVPLPAGQPMIRFAPSDAVDLYGISDRLGDDTVRWLNDQGLDAANLESRILDAYWAGCAKDAAVSIGILHGNEGVHRAG